MMPAAEQGPLVWPRVLRLAQAVGRIGGIGNWAVFALLVGWLSLIGFIGLTTHNTVGHAGSLGMIWFVLTAHYLHVTTGLCNKGWRILPVATRERRAAAWMLVSLLPLLLALMSTLVDMGLGAFVGEHDMAVRGLIQFGLRGVSVEAYALIAIVFGTWPESAAGLWQMDRRQPRDWLMYGAMGLIFIAMVMFGDRLAALPGAGPIVAGLACGLCAVLLPLTLRVIRLDFASLQTGLLDGLSDAVQRRFGLRLSGWSGHFVRELRRTAMFWAWMALVVTITSRLLPAQGGLGTRDAAFREGLRQGMSLGMASLVCVIPAMTAAIIATATQQYFLRSRLLLLSLPQGDRLILITPLFNAMLVFVATLALIGSQLAGEPSLGLKLTVSALYGLAMVR